MWARSRTPDAEDRRGARDEGAQVVWLSKLVAPCYAEAHRDLCVFGHSEYWFQGGRGSAKSSFISIEILLGLLRNPGANAIIYRRVAATLRESVYEQMAWAIDQFGLSAYFRFRLAPLEIDFLPTGQRILFRGADDPGKSKSIKLSRGYFGYLWFEELAEFAGMDDIRTIKASVIRGTGAAHRKRAITFYSYNPPRSANSWVNAEALEGLRRADRLTHRSTYLDVPRAWLGEDFIREAEQLRAVNETAYRCMYLGEVTGSGGQVFENVRLGEAEAQGRAMNGLDFGFAVDPDAFVRVDYDARSRQLRILDEFYAVRAPVERLAAEVSARAREEPVRCDSADPRMIQLLRGYGVNAVGARKGPGSVARGIRWLQERSAIVIDPERCPNAAREFTGYEYQADGFGNFMAEYPDRNNHLIDAVRYAVEPLSGESRAARTFDRNLLEI